MGHLSNYPGAQDALFDGLSCYNRPVFERLYPSWYNYRSQSYDEQKFNELSNTEKLGKAISYAIAFVPGEAGRKMSELMTPVNLALAAGSLSILVGVQFVPVGWVADLVMVGMASTVVLALGADAVEVAQELFFFTRTVVGAQNEIQLRSSSHHLARAIAILGIDGIVAILLKKAIFRSKVATVSTPEVPPRAPSISTARPVLSPPKSPSSQPPPKKLPVIELKIQRQMESRGWTVEAINSTVANSEKKIPTKDTRFDPITGARRNDPATVHVNSDGSYVVVNNRDGTVVQVSNKNDPNWKAPW